MPSKVAKAYGASKGTPEWLLRPGAGGGFNYPQWHIDWWTGNCPNKVKLHYLAKRLLQLLSDGKWHTKVWVNGIGTGTIEACLDLELTQYRETNDSSTTNGGRHAEFKITLSGLQVLKTGYLSAQKFSEK